MAKLYVDILQDLPGFEKKLSSTTEVASFVASGTRNEAFDRVMGKCYLGLLLL
jgi:hypothetical protein